MDLEFHFSANPFVTQDISRFRMIRPNKSGKITLPAGGNHVFALPTTQVSGGAAMTYSLHLDAGQGGGGV